MTENLDLLSIIAGEIVRSGKPDNINWIEVTVVFGFNDDNEVRKSYGYVYDQSGKSHATSYLIPDVERAVNAYVDWLRTQHDEPLVKLLFQFNRETGQVKADFEYDDAARWQVTPRNIDTIAQELRPKFGG